MDVRFGSGAAARAEALRQTGAEVIEVSSRYQTVTVAALPTQLRAVAAVPGVEGVQEEITPFTAAAPCPQGLVVSEGDRQLEAARARNDFGVDLDLFVLNEEGTLVGRAFNTPNTEPGRRQPFEFIPYEGGIGKGRKTEQMQVVIARCDGACGEERAEEAIGGEKPYEGTVGGDDGTPRLKVAIFNNGGGVTESQYPESKDGDIVGPTIFGHTGASAAISVAAINVGTDEEPEPYSSRGPVVHLFGPVTGTAPAAPIGEEVIAKPNLTAGDCGSTTFFYGFSEGGFHFCGTSAAAPHAAAVAALIRSANPGASNAQVRADLETTARPVGDSLGFYEPSAVGAGLVDADSAVAALALPPTVTITGPPAAKGNVTQPSIAFTANRRANFTCSIDGGAATPCASPYVPPAPLAEGSHEFKVTATDVAGRSGTAMATFAIEATAPAAPPVARFVKHPKSVVKTRKGSVKLSFRVASSVPGSTFLCKVDRSTFKRCEAGFSAVFKPGRHAVSAEAVDPAGTVGKPATFRFQVKKVAKKHGATHRRHRRH